MARRKQKEPASEQADGGGGATAVAGEESAAGTLAPSAELEAALAEATEAVDAEPREGADGEADGPDAEPVEEPAAAFQALKEEHESTVGELEKLRDQHLRLQAEFENFRRRGLKEKQETQLFGHQNLVKELLPVVDNLVRAVEHAEQSSSEELQQLLQGVELVRRELSAVLERFGVSEIEAEGAAFDPAMHEAMAQMPTAEVEPNTVVAVMEKGYQLHDRMLRPARVVVSKALDESQSEPESDD